jgi:carbonic anhydrase/acetyltransferase-like protein (isoleucine patch superfamily)
MKKYELTQESVQAHDLTLHRVKALIDFGQVSAGDIGGFVESEANLSQEGTCWIYDNSGCSGNSCVSGDASVSEGSWIYGDATVSGNATVRGSSWISGNAAISDNALVSGKSLVSGNATVSGSASVSDQSWVSGNAKIRGNTELTGRAWVCGSATAKMSGILHNPDPTKPQMADDIEVDSAESDDALQFTAELIEVYQQIYESHQ